MFNEYSTPAHLFGWPIRRGGRKHMPRITDEQLHAVVYLYPTVEAAEKNEPAGGTGFLVGVASKTSAQYFHIYAITNDHIICSQKDGNIYTSPVIRWTLPSGETKYIKKEVGDWLPHPVADVAITAIGTFTMDSEAKYSIPSRLGFLTQKAIDEFGIGPGDETFMIGRFAGHEGTRRNRPSVRFGNISMMPDEPIVWRKKEQYSYLVEGRSLAGYSGSPVFVHIPPFHRNFPDEKKRERFHGPWLLGIDCGHYLRPENLIKRISGGWDANITNKDWLANANSGMMVVAPCSYINELLNEEDLEAKRMEKDEELRKENQNQAAMPDNLESPQNEDEYTEEDMHHALKKAFKPNEDETSGEEK